MRRDRYLLIKELFQLAIEREAGQRAAFLEQACAGNAELRAEVERLLAYDEHESPFMETPAYQVTIVGQRIGPYKILNELGRGGMGAVYLAERVDGEYKKQVAIKLVKRGMDTDAILRRFRNERQILANLDHPNIAKLLDGGTTEDGLSYFVMDHVEGLPIDVYCDAHNLPTVGRLELFWAACAAVQYAHQHQVIHRDLKPSNILVTAEGVPKLLDFGIAKVLNTEFSGRTLDQTAGPRPMTPQYASPEQVRGEAITPMSDVYSLGVMLYELLTGHGPYRLSGRTPQEAERVICEQEPEKPSTVIGDVEEVAGPDGKAPIRLAPASVSEVRDGQAEKLRRQLAGDLDTIVLMAMRKEPERRYLSVAAFAQDIRRHLEGLPVIARRDTLWYRSTKFIKRNTTGVLTSAITALVLLALISVGLFLATSRNRATGQAIQSLAVLPLENLSGDKEQDYFADGMTEALINDLAQIRALRVISRTSAMQFKGVSKPLPEIARQLKVDAVVEGSVLRSGNRVRITAELIDGSTDRHLWAKTYERDGRDIVALQSDVASAIAQEIKIKLSPEEQVRVTSRRPVDREAYEAYLKGRYYWNKRAPGGLNRAIDYFQQAIDKDPRYAVAYSGLADCYALLPPLSGAAPKEVFPNAKAAALKAVQIDDTVAEAHASLANIMANYDFDWTGAEREFKRALELNPNYVPAHQQYGYYLLTMGRPEEALRETKVAQELDPLSLSSNSQVGRCFYHQRRYDRAIEQFRKTLEIDSNFPSAHVFLAKAYLQKGMYEEALAELQQTKVGTVEPRALSAYIHAISGKRAPATRVLTELLELSKTQYVPAYHIAVIYAGLGDNNQAFAWLAKAYESRDQWLRWLKVEPIVDSLRSDPRFQDLLRRVGLPP